MDEPTLFDELLPAVGETIPARGTDPATSHAATAAIRVTANNQRGRLLRAFRGVDKGLTDEEAAEFAPEVSLHSEYSKRCSELRAEGLIAPTGETRHGRAGVARLVSALTDLGRAKLAELDREDPPPLSARSRERFPTLAKESACPWHDDCTPMDCENHRRFPSEE